MTDPANTEANVAAKSGPLVGISPPGGVAVPADAGGDPGATSGPVETPRRRGRPKGSKNRRTVEVEKALRPTLPKAKRKLRSLIESEDAEIAFRAVQLVMAYSYGKPTERREISGTDGGPMLLEFLRSLPA